MKISNIRTALTIAKAANDNVHMIGPHGIGKTEYVKQWANDNDMHIEVLQLPILEVSDLIGMPDITETEFGKVTTFAAPEWIQRLQAANKAGKHCVIFMDELGRASAEIRQASLQIVLEKKVNEHFLPSLDGVETLCVVADNPSDEYDTAEFDKALEDRFQTYSVEADISDWLKYARKAGVQPVITDFLAEYQEKLQYTPETDGEKGSSPRAWKKLSDALKVCEDEDFVYPLISSKVGKTVGASFFHFYNNYIDIVKPEDVMEEIGEMDIKTEKGQRAAAKKLRKLTENIETVSATELAQKMVKMVQEKEIPAEAVIVLLASLNLEIAASVAKGWKDGTEEEAGFYYGDFVEAQTKSRWFIKSMIEMASK